MSVVKVLRPMAVAALVLVTSHLSAQAGQEEKSTVTVTLWDKGADAEMKMDMGMGMTGDHTMSNMGLKLSQASVRAGEVTFNVSNTSKDQIHEMIVVPYPASGKMPYSDKDAKFDEDAAKSLGEVSELDPSKAGTLTLHLAPGKYVLTCNVPNHYANGMWTVLTVTD